MAPIIIAIVRGWDVDINDSSTMIDPRRILTEAGIARIRELRLFLRSDAAGNGMQDTFETLTQIGARTAIYGVVRPMRTGLENARSQGSEAAS